MRPIPQPDTGNPSGPPGYFIRTFGCQMNVADSLRYACVMESLGCISAESEVACDILIVNTCSVREKAEEKAISWLGSVIQKRAEFHGGRNKPAGGGIAFVGCMATVRGGEILERFPQVRTVIPARELDTFEERIVRAWPEFGGGTHRDAFPLLRPEEKYERFLPIIRGCINHCTYCIVPRARGDRLESKPPGVIFSEIEELIESGVKSITLLGQNVCAYGTEIDADNRERLSGWSDVNAGYNLATLLGEIRDRFDERDVWFKFLTSHPRDVTDELIDVIAGHPMFSRHFHLPIQAGDDEVLRRMGRGYTAGFYIELVDRIRRKIPDMRLTTDLIVGFPGEDEAAFEKTLDVVRQVGFDSAFTFLYSTRSGTPAEKWADPVPREEKKSRLQALIELQNRIALERAIYKIGQERDVLIEGPSTGSRETGRHAGRTREEEVVQLAADAGDVGKRVRVKIIEARLRSFIGEPIGDKPGPLG